MNQIIFLPLGGLGNQLFLYGTALVARAQFDLPIRADLRNFVRYRWHDYELDSFSNSIDQTGIPQLLESRGREFSKIEFGLRKKMQGFWERASIVHYNEDWEQALEKRLRARPLLTSLIRVANQENRAQAILQGYFNSFNHLEPVRARMRTETLAVNNPSRWYLDKLEELGREDFLSIHVRRGNYLAVPDATVIGEAYYEEAIRVARAMHGDLPIRVFSDSPSLAKTMSCFAGLDDCAYVTPPSEGEADGVRPVEVMNLMSMAYASIAGNSTFSMWSAWLGKSDNRVMVPRPFSKRVQLDERFLIPSRWLSISY